MGVGLSSYFWLGQNEQGASRSAYNLDSKKTIQGLSEEDFNILYLASLAPSGHNTQPWTIAVKGTKNWIIGSAQKRWLPAVDPENREMMLSIGAFIENLTVAAAIRGYEAEIDIIANSCHSTEIAEVRLHKRNAELKTDRAMEERRTVRKHILTDMLSEEDISYFIHNNKNNVFYYPLRSKEGVYLSQATLNANKIQILREDVQRELAEWIRWGDREARNYNNGLTPDSMEMEGIVRWYAKNFLSKKDVLSKTFRDETIKLVEDQVKNCAGWLVVTSENSGISELINAGRVLQSTWLRAHERGIAFHPMTQVLEENLFNRELSKTLGHAGHVQFVVRVGYIKKHLKPVSLRMPIADIIVSRSSS